ncbi:MAG: diaminopropionate ammonia-lyase [Alphaproteobacteria bacterium]|nr:diaminopropionate ammonia-lyase [Alphaproteobacteria bacterium]
MNDFMTNPYIGKKFLDNVPKLDPTKIETVKQLLQLCPIAKPTPLRQSPALADSLNIGTLSLKDERNRMNLGSFKALGAAYVIAKRAAEKLTEKMSDGDINSIDEAQWHNALNGEVFITASAGNHGISVAAGARIFGAKAVIYLAKTVPTDFATRLKNYGAEVVIAGDDYDASLAEAMQAAETNDWYLLADGTWQGYNIGTEVMEGYLVMADETYHAMQDAPPTHIFLQAGVGGLAAAAAIMARYYFADTDTMPAPQIIVVEPDEAPCLQQSIQAGKLVEVTGGISNMGRLDCKTPSLVALDTLAHTANHFMLVSDEEATNAMPLLAAHDFATTPSGGAGFVGLQKAIQHQQFNLDKNSHVLIYLSEQAL